MTSKSRYYLYMDYQNNNGGRPNIPDDQYQRWLSELKPFLIQGYSLWHAIDICSLSPHKDSIYRKMKKRDWFCEKITHFQSTISELVNSSLFRIIENLHNKLISDPNYRITHQDVTLIKLVFERYHTKQDRYLENMKVEIKPPTINYISPINKVV